MDYAKLGLKVGLEIHQQLDSKTKLFCRCPIERTEEFPIEVRRKLRAVPGELGDTDPAALQEYLKNRVFVYRASSYSSCLVEIDEEPPRPANDTALRTCMQMCKLLHCHILDEVHVMRKTVVDGSAVSGFQRTALVGTGGYVDGSFGKVDVRTVTMEEDSATPVSKGNDQVEYRLDRLGIPLIEIATDSSINSPQMAKEVAAHIGLLLRSTDVMRGIGTIRQDVNISIQGGARIEIKGFQELDKIPRVIENEVNRQLALLEIKEELKKRGFRSVSSQPADVTRGFANTKANFIRKVIDNNGLVFALLLPKFAGLFKRTCGDRTFGKEMSNYAGAYGLGIIHSDEELEKYQLGWEFRKLREELRAEAEDLILISAGNSRTALDNAMSLLVYRANQCVHGVPEETRVADGEGSKYARPLPGSGRLYPESDLPPIRITKELRAVDTPKTLMERQEETVAVFVKRGMNEKVARAVATYKNLRSDEIKLVTELMHAYRKVDPNLIAKMVVEMPKEIKTRFRLEQVIDRSVYVSILNELNKGTIPSDSVLFILVDYLTGKSLDEAIAKYKTLTDAELRRIIKKVVEKNKGQKESALMGLVMKEIRGKAPGEKVSKILREMI